MLPSFSEGYSTQVEGIEVVTSTEEKRTKFETAIEDAGGLADN